jgi:hypothetical protein
MNWKGKELTTIGDLMRDGMEKCETPEEAQEFMKLYRSENQHADQNIGYLTGYYDPEKMLEMQKFFGVAHPIFGNSQPTNGEALAAGMLAAMSRK